MLHKIHILVHFVVILHQLIMPLQRRHMNINTSQSTTNSTVGHRLKWPHVRHQSSKLLANLGNHIVGLWILFTKGHCCGSRFHVTTSSWMMTSLWHWCNPSIIICQLPSVLTFAPDILVRIKFHVTWRHRTHYRGQKRRYRYADSPGRHQGRWNLPSTSPVTIRAVLLTTFPFQGSMPNVFVTLYW